ESDRPAGRVEGTSHGALTGTALCAVTVKHDIVKREVAAVVEDAAPKSGGRRPRKPAVLGHATLDHQIIELDLGPGFLDLEHPAEFAGIDDGGFGTDRPRPGDLQREGCCGSRRIVDV